MMVKVSTNKNKLDIELIHKILSKCCYWAKDVPLEIVQKSIDNSYCFGAYSANDQLIGFVRVITDYCTYGYITDAFVLPEHQGNGIFRYLMDCVLGDEQLQNFKTWSLVSTPQSKALYKELGFSELKENGDHLEINDLEIYSRQHVVAY
ncbi:GNAT family N-acetyltransferase [Piscirickettsia litoralis]|nr:GNAT family N-acetyltransferase [Piscirickettsia litoralis]